MRRLRRARGELPGEGEAGVRVTAGFVGRMREWVRLWTTVRGDFLLDTGCQPDALPAGASNPLRDCRQLSVFGRMIGGADVSRFPTEKASSRLPTLRFCPRAHTSPVWHSACSATMMGAHRFYISSQPFQFFEYPPAQCLKAPCLKPDRRPVQYLRALNRGWRTMIASGGRIPAGRGPRLLPRPSRRPSGPACTAYFC